MPDFFDMVQCKECGTWHLPTFTVTGRIEPHCLGLPRTGKLPQLGQLIDLEV